MNLIQIQPDGIVLGQPLPFSLHTEDGSLLARKGDIIHSSPALDLLQQGRSIYVESLLGSRLTGAALSALMGLDTPLAEIVSARPNQSRPQTRNRAGPDDQIDWRSMQLRLSRLGHHNSKPQAMAQLDVLHAQLSQQVLRYPDASLLTLFHLSINDGDFYSSTHALLVSALCTLAAKDVFNWSEKDRQSLGKAALTMNFAMAEMQDQLAQQRQPPSDQQRRLIDHHPVLSVRLLQQLGVADSHWLDAISCHHSVGPGPLSQHSVALQMARLIKRADVFLARLSPRVARAPMTTSVALQAAYFDEQHQVDEAGTALIKVVGVYPPATFVELVNGEVAVVIKRGHLGTAPKVAVLINKVGTPTSEPVVRHTDLADYRVRASVPRTQVKIHVDLNRLLALI